MLSGARAPSTSCAVPVAVGSSCGVRTEQSELYIWQGWQQRPLCPPSTALPPAGEHTRQPSGTGGVLKSPGTH